MTEDSILREKSYAFALRIIKAYQYLSTEQKEFVLSKQLLRSGTSIGASIREARYAQSKADFVHKLSIAIKEAGETEYWLMLLRDSKYIDDKVFESIASDCVELLKILTSSINTLKRNK